MLGNSECPPVSQFSFFSFLFSSRIVKTKQFACNLYSSRSASRIVSTNISLFPCGRKNMHTYVHVRSLTVVDVFFVSTESLFAHLSCV